MFASYRVMVFDPEGRQIKDIVFSSRHMSCTTWGGKNFDILYIAAGTDKKLTPVEDEGGHVFRYKPENVKGMPKYEFDG